MILINEINFESYESTQIIFISINYVKKILNDEIPIIVPIKNHTTLNCKLTLIDIVDYYYSSELDNSCPLISNIII